MAGCCPLQGKIALLVLVVFVAERKPSEHWVQLKLQSDHSFSSKLADVFKQPTGSQMVHITWAIEMTVSLQQNFLFVFI